MRYPDALDYKIIKPHESFSDFAESFWMLHNKSNEAKEVIILPDGRIDLFFSQSDAEPFHITLLGITTEAEKAMIIPETLIFAVSFKLLAAEYIFRSSFVDLLNKGKNLPEGFWNFRANDMNNFDIFRKKASEKIQSVVPEEPDKRKLQLFNLIYSSKGSISVKELSEKVFWSDRQINRYFNRWFGISLKAYCNILRFRSSFKHISEGKLFPEQDFSDQNHFIKDIKKYTGVTPKVLSKNKDGRFVQITALKNFSS